MKKSKIAFLALVLSFTLCSTAFSWGKWACLESPSYGKPWDGVNKNIRWAKVIANEDGRLELFTVEVPTGVLYHKWQLSPGSWSGSSWHAMGKPGSANIDPDSDLAVGRNKDGRIEVFVKSQDHEIWHKYQIVANGYWSGWHNLSSPEGRIPLFDDVVVTSDSAKRLFVWATGGDGNIWFRNQSKPNSAWQDWAKIAKPLQTNFLIDPPAVGINANGWFEIFSIGLNGRLYSTGPFIPFLPMVDWHSIFSPENIYLGREDAPKIYPNKDGRLEAFMVGDKKAWHIRQTTPSGDWTPLWQPLPDLLVSASDVFFGPEPIANADGRIELFFSDASGEVHHIWQTSPNGNWSKWEKLYKENYMQFAFLTAARNADGKIQVFTRDTSERIWYIKQ